MVSRKQEKPSKTNSSLKTPKTHTKFKNKKNQPPSIKAEKKKKKDKKKSSSNSEVTVTPASASQYRSFFLNAFQSANALQLSSIELESIKETSFLESSQELGQEVEDLGKHVKAAFGPSWKQVLCERQLVDGKIEPGSPAVLIISTSALRSIELLRSKHCPCNGVHLLFFIFYTTVKE
ncbi:uncharacterized protein LOC131183004 [Hevea brasiliensis]|uniref:uncharacterized protein LOC131183004 n=1 Tax=Hevea brasiliensis TaxID=3981 RepID=UPI0025FA5646|nr:uncharacterized protein LOC131183004 [Hevea brasiliensis]